MRMLLIALVASLVCGCAAQERDRAKTDAVEDFIEVAELEEQDVVRMPEQYSYDILSDRYVIVKTRKTRHLVQFRRRCLELYETRPEPDFPQERNTLRARFDTIRGCRIEKIYPIEPGQADELEELGKAPGETS